MKLKSFKKKIMVKAAIRKYKKKKKNKKRKKSQTKS
jgi:hypothetical protein